MLHLHTVSCQHLTTDKDKIKAVRDSLEKNYHDWTPTDRRFCDDTAIERYLKARKGDVAHAAKQLLNTVKWRKEFDIEGLEMSEFDHELAAGRMYIAGHDSEGHPVLLSKKRNDKMDPARLDDYVRYLVFTLESVVRSMRNGKQQWTWIMDLHSYSSSNSPPLRSTIQFLTIFMEHYPERLHKCYVVDAPTIFWVLFKAIGPFIDPTTKAKIVFVYTKDMPASSCNPADAPQLLSAEQARFCKEYLPKLRAGYSEAAYRAVLADAYGGKTLDELASHLCSKDATERRDSISVQLVGVTISCGKDIDA